MTIVQSRTKILFHGRLADLFGRDLDVEAPQGCSIAHLREIIAAEFPNAAEELQGRRVRAAVGDSIVADSYRIVPGEQVEFLPPVSGG
jgi:molybdopterin converting factor small subunit